MNYTVIDSSKKTIASGNMEVPLKPVYKVVIASKYGVFSGSASPCEQDMPYLNDFDGYKFAEKKAAMKLYRHRVQYFEQRYEGVKNAYDIMCEQFKNKIVDDDYSAGIKDTLKAMERRVKIAKRDADIMRNTYRTLKKDFPAYTDAEIEHRKSFIEKGNEFLEKKKNK